MPPTPTPTPTSYTFQDMGGCNCSTVTFCGCTGVPTTLTGTHTVLGVFSLSWTGTMFIGTHVYAYPGTADCPAQNVTITLKITCSSGVWQASFIWHEKIHLGCSTCPDDTGVTVVTLTPVSASSTTCSPLSVSWSFAGTWTPPCEVNAFRMLVQGVASTLTVTP